MPTTINEAMREVAANPQNRETIDYWKKQFTEGELTSEQLSAILYPPRGRVPLDIAKMVAAQEILDQTRNAAKQVLKNGIKKALD